MKQSGVKKGFLLVLSAFMLSAATTLMIPFSTGKDGCLNRVGYAAGIIFWLGLAAGITGYILLVRKIKAGHVQGTEETRQEKGRLTVFRFFSNPPAGIMDIVMIIGMAGTIYCAVNITVNQMAAAVFLLMLLAGIYLHFLLNGNIYRYIWNHAASKNRKEMIKRKD